MSDPVYLKLFPPAACNMVVAQPRRVGVEDAPPDFQGSVNHQPGRPDAACAVWVQVSGAD